MLTGVHREAHCTAGRPLYGREISVRQEVYHGGRGTTGGGVPQQGVYHSRVYTTAERVYHSGEYTTAESIPHREVNHTER